MNHDVLLWLLNPIPIPALCSPVLASLLVCWTGSITAFLDVMRSLPFRCSSSQYICHCFSNHDSRHECAGWTLFCVLYFRHGLLIGREEKKGERKSRFVFALRGSTSTNTFMSAAQTQIKAGLQYNNRWDFNCGKETKTI